jgi:hypothetical protein
MIEKTNRIKVKQTEEVALGERREWEYRAKGKRARSLDVRVQGYKDIKGETIEMIKEFQKLSFTDQNRGKSKDQEGKEDLSVNFCMTAMDD